MHVTTYDAQEKNKGVAEERSGLRYAAPNILDLFFKLEQYCAATLKLSTVTSDTYAELQCFVSESPAMLQLWWVALENLGMYARIADDNALYTAGRKVYDMLTTQYLHVWLGEFKRQAEVQLNIVKVDELRKHIKNAAKKQQRLQAVQHPAQGGQQQGHESNEFEGVDMATVFDIDTEAADEAMEEWIRAPSMDV